MKWFLGSFTLAVYLFMHLPLAVIVMFSFSEGEVLSLPITGWTLDWYREALHDERLIAGLMNSLKIATSATVLASLLGTLGAFAVQRYQFFGRKSFRMAVVMPIVL